MRPIFGATFTFLLLIAIATPSHGEAMVGAGGHFSEGSEPPGDPLLHQLSISIDLPVEANEMGDSYTAFASVDRTNLLVGATAKWGPSVQGIGAVAHATATWFDVLRIEDSGGFFQSPFADLAYAHIATHAEGIGAYGEVDYSLEVYENMYLGEMVDAGSTEFNETYQGDAVDLHVKVPIRWFDEGARLWMSLHANVGLVDHGVTSTIDRYGTATLPPILIADENGDPIPGLANFDLHMLGAQIEYPITLTKIPSKSNGNYNGDSAVDAADYIIWRKLFLEEGINLAADGNTDFEVDQDDYDVWRSNFGRSNGGGGSGHAPIPEPAAGTLLLIAIVVNSALFQRASRRAASPMPAH